MWDASKAMLRGKFIVLNAYIRKEERSKINNLSFHFRNVEKKQMKPTTSRRKGIIKIRTEINKLENNTQNNKTKSWLLGKINKIRKYLARLIKKKREKTKMINIRNERGMIRPTHIYGIYSMTYYMTK